MTDAEYAELKARLQLLAAKWHAVLGLKDWHVKYRYCRTGLPPRGLDTPDTSTVALARARVSWQYLDAEISFDMPLAAELDDKRLEWVFVHECMHVLINEMRWQDHGDADNLDHEERVATVLARSFIWAYEAGRSQSTLLSAQGSTGSSC